jgi:hypothetical protein
MKKLYISATYHDVTDHRDAVTHALGKMGTSFVAWKIMWERTSAPTYVALRTRLPAISMSRYSLSDTDGYARDAQ